MAAQTGASGVTGANGAVVTAPRAVTRRTVMRALRLGAVIAVVLIVVIVGITVLVESGPPTEDDLIREAGLVGKSELLIGVLDDQPGIALQDPNTGQFSGFDIDVAYMIAADLGFDRSSVRFLPIESKDRARMQARDGSRFVTVDLVIAAYSITREREDQPGVNFSAPYLRTAQSVMTRRSHPPVQSLNDLRDETTCTITTSTSVVLRQSEQERVIAKNKIKECVDELREGRIDAVLTDSAILAGFVHAHPGELMLHELGMDVDELWGVNCGSNAALRALVNLSLYHSRYDPSDHRWEDAFDRNLRPEQRDSLPQQIAIDQQPPVDRVPVREWPWQKHA